MKAGAQVSNEGWLAIATFSTIPVILLYTWGLAALIQYATNMGWKEAFKWVLLLYLALGGIGCIIAGITLSWVNAFNS